MFVLKAFFKKNTVLAVAAVLALLSAAAVPPDREYLGYMNAHVLTVLFVLMASVAGFSAEGLFVRLSAVLTRRTGDFRRLSMGLVLLCFFLAAVITNDVALITFVPFTLGLFGASRRVIPVVVMETVAANLGSLLTPIGNPQNLYLYSHYGLRPGDFFGAVWPLGLVCLGLTAALTRLLVPAGAPCERREPGRERTSAFALGRYGLMFALGLLCVLNVLSWPVCLGLCTALMLVFDRHLFRSVDYSLLLSFVAFFVLVGNLGRMEPVSRLMAQVVEGNELLAGALLSQVISNVPAATMLAGFTENWRELLLGVNIGGLGTPIASMASLISLRLYGMAEGAESGRYLALFSAVNFALLILLLLLGRFLL